jgi:cytoskeletal protein RodZ
VSRKDRHHSPENNETQEPWEQPIYETEDDETSRSSQRKQKKGNTLFLSLFLVLCIAIPAGAYFWIRNGSSSNEAASSTELTSSVVESKESSTKESSTVESTEETTSDTVAETETAATNEAADTSVETADTNAAQTTPTSEDQTIAGGTTDNTVAEGAATTDAAGQTGETTAAAGSTIAVQAGEGPKQVAARAGISIEELLQLNGMTMDNYMLYPGQELKIK